MQATELCRKCSSISLERLSTGITSSHADLNFSSLHCPLCALILESLWLDYCRTSLYIDRPQPLPSVGDPLFATFDNFRRLLGTGSIVFTPKYDTPGTVFAGPTERGACVTGFNVVSSHSKMRGIIKLHVITGDNANPQGEVIGRPRLSNSDCPEAFALIKAWFTSCQAQHDKCINTFTGCTINNSTYPELPTRVLDVGFETKVVQLVESKGLKGRYIALSHCWGPPEKQPLTTTKENLQEHLQEVPWRRIPKTFQDAIVVTRELGLRYLWIDSLCIIQGDSDDWYREAGRMGDVYEYAELTIGASHATNSHEGLFLERSPTPPSVTLPDFLPDTNSPTVCATIIRDAQVDLFPEPGPLNKRAWATQEWLLSRRMIFYTKGQIVWSCKTTSQRETGEKCFNTARNPKWKIAVEQYSERNLTKPTDKLMALEGLKSRYTQRLEDEYLYGIWRNALPDQLLWQVCNRAERQVNPLGLPTWTWASTSGGVRFLPLKNAKNLCEHIHDKGKKSAVLKIRGAMRSVTLGLRQASSNVDLEHRILDDIADSNARLTRELHSLIFDGHRLVGWAMLDYLSVSALNEPIHGLTLMGNVTRKDEDKEDLLGKAVSKKNRAYWTLLLQKSGGLSDEYVRVGVGKIFGREWWSGATISVVNII